MKYESKAENNVEKTVINEFIPNWANKKLTGSLGRGQQRFGANVQGNQYKPQQTAAALYKNLVELLASDPNAEQTKMDVIKLLYRAVKGGPLGGQQPQQQAAQPQNGQQQIPGTF